MRVVALAALITFAAPVSAAPPTEAQKAFQEGTKHFEKGRFADAAERFEQAFELDQNHAYLFNAAVAYERAGSVPDALRLYEKFAVFSDNRVRVAQVRDTIRELEVKLGQTHARLKVDVDPPGSYVFLDGGTRPLATPFERWMPAGRHELVVKRPGFEPATQAFDLVAGEPRTVRVNLSVLKTYGRVVLATDPPGARVLLDGTEAGVAPLTLPKVPAGPHTIRVEAKDHLALERAVVVEKDTDLSLTVTLARAPDVRKAAPEPAGDAPPPLVKRWWLWTTIGVVVAGGVAAAVVVLTRDPGEAAPAAASGGTWQIDRSRP